MSCMSVRRPINMLTKGCKLQCVFLDTSYSTSPHAHLSLLPFLASLSRLPLFPLHLSLTLLPFASLLLPTSFLLSLPLFLPLLPPPSTGSTRYKQSQQLGVPPDCQPLFSCRPSSQGPRADLSFVTLHKATRVGSPHWDSFLLLVFLLHP